MKKATEHHKRTANLPALQSLVEDASELFCSGVAPKMISQILSERYGCKVDRIAAYRFLQKAANTGVLVLQRGEAIEVQSDLAACLRDYGVRSVSIASTILHRDVAMKTGSLLVQMLASMVKEGRTEAKIGWAGGQQCRLVAQDFADRIKSPDLPLPKKLLCQTLVGAWDVDSPMLHPNAFFSYFDSREIRDSKIEFKFRALYAPVLVSKDMEDLLANDENLKAARADALDLDVIITSASLATDNRNMFHKFYEALACKNPLEKLNYVGDFLAIPFSASGPIARDKIRADFTLLTLLDPEQIKAMVRRGKEIVLTAGPSQGHGDAPPRLRTKIIELVVRCGMVTRLCTDIQTGKALLALFRETHVG